jgi:hypothetical protein
LSLQWINKSEKGKIARWAIFLNEFNFELIYRKGSLNGAADAASRLNRVTEPWEYDDDVFTRQECNDFTFVTKTAEKVSSQGRVGSVIALTTHSQVHAV